MFKLSRIISAIVNSRMKAPVFTNEGKRELALLISFCNGSRPKHSSDSSNTLLSRCAGGRHWNYRRKAASQLGVKLELISICQLFR